MSDDVFPPGLCLQTGLCLLPGPAPLIGGQADTADTRQTHGGLPLVGEGGVGGGNSYLCDFHVQFFAREGSRSSGRYVALILAGGLWG